jgi:uncharacterized protein
MGGTKTGGYKVREKLLAKDPDYYKKLGQLGGKKSRGGGFQKGDPKTVKSGSIGGSRSRRGLKLVKETKRSLIYLNNRGEKVRFKK